MTRRVIRLVTVKTPLRPLSSVSISKTRTNPARVKDLNEPARRVSAAKARSLVKSILVSFWQGRFLIASLFQLDLGELSLGSDRIGMIFTQLRRVFLR